MEKTDPHKTVQFFCPPPCEGQIYVIGAIIRRGGIHLVGKCDKCNENAGLDMNKLLKEMCEFVDEVRQ